MSLLWIRPPRREAACSPAERRVRDFLASPAGVSETVASLAAKLDVSRAVCREVLEELVEQGVVRRHDFADIDPIYTRFPGRA